MPERIPSIFPGGRFRAPGRGGRGRQAGGFGPGGECWCPQCNTKFLIKEEYLVIL
jgi:hypothetical protein